MQIAAIPADEALRLQELDALKVLDTPCEERFDRITRLAARHFGVPMAFVSLVDRNRQWFKSRVGMEACETGRKEAFCSHAILFDEGLVIEDTLRDPRFADNPLVTDGPRIRFYAGYPIRGRNGHAVGTLCIADRKPRSFTDVDLEMIKTLAEIVEREINLVDVIEVQGELLDARRQLIASRELLAGEIAEAAEYVQSLLPKPFQGKTAANWMFRPSSQLGGDAFGYQWLDADRFAFYLLDVSGHGVGAALLSVSAITTLNSRTLPGTDFGSPAAVMKALNEAYQMDRHDNRFFTGWYGVYDRKRHTLRYAGAGHPPALLLSGDSPAAVRPATLDAQGLIIGVTPDYPYEDIELKLKPWNRLFLYSDGVFELTAGDVSQWSMEHLHAHLAQHSAQPHFRPDDLLAHLLTLHPSGAFPDDLSLLQVDMIK